MVALRQHAALKPRHIPRPAVATVRSPPTGSPWVNHERRWRPTPRVILFSILSSSALSKFRNIRHSVRESSPLLLGIAAAIVAAAVGLATGLIFRFRAICHSVSENSLLPLGVAAAIVAAVVGLTTGLASAFAATPAASAPLHARAASHTVAARPAGGIATTNLASRSKAVLADRAAPAHRNHLQAVSQRAAVSDQPYTIYDSVTPSEIPAHQKVATYADGDYAVSPSQVAGRGQVAWIDVSGSDIDASAVDVEPGNATPSTAANWALDKLRAQPHSVAWIYTMQSEWPAVKAAVATTLPSGMRSHVRWWIADPTGVPHLVPGSSATQWYWGPNYDISEADQQGL